jgi:SAM-dependent methyltransferase
VLEHVPHPDVVAREIMRVLKTGGCCLITVPQSGELHETPNDYFRYTNYGIEVLFLGLRAELIHKERRGGFFTLIIYTVVRYLTERWHLYSRRRFGRIMSGFFRVASFAAFWLDQHDTTSAGRHHTIGWAFVFRKLQ